MSDDGRGMAAALDRVRPNVSATCADPIDDLHLNILPESQIHDTANPPSILPLVLS